MAKATQLAKIDSSIKISNGLERKARCQGTKRRRLGVKKKKSNVQVEVSEGAASRCVVLTVVR